MNGSTTTLLEVAAVAAPLGATLGTGLLSLMRRVSSIETKVDAMWQCWLEERKQKGGAP